MLQFVSSVTLPCPAAALRAYLGRPQNLPEISDPEIELEILSAPDEVAVGAKIVFRITAMGLRQRMTHEYKAVSDLEIQEVLVEGPLPAWQHTQRIQSLGDAECELTDEVLFQLPGGMMKFLLTEERIRESLSTGMAHRYATLQELIRSGALT